MGYVDMVEKGVVGGGGGSKTRGGTMFETFIPEPQAETAACRSPLLPPPSRVLARSTDWLYLGDLNSFTSSGPAGRAVCLSTRVKSGEPG